MNGLELLGYPPSNGDNWRFCVRPAEVLDAAQVEIVSGPEPPQDTGGNGEA